ncbi:MAG TPA: alanine racemase [Thermoanaerobaculia bacterium]|nr:alanine racemase [Thermoanaerobaculia bacterium]
MTTLADLPTTPSLLVDLPRLRRNCERMLAFARERGVRLRPHVKTHKCVEIARLQHGGEIGPITVSTLAEAEHFAAAGFADILYAVPIEPGKLDRVVALCRRIDLAVLVNDLATLDALADAAARSGTSATGGAARPRVLLELDCGDGRSGLDPSGDELLVLARAVAERPSLRFAGMLTHAGHSYADTDDAAVRASAQHERDVVVAAAERLRAGGLAVETVSLGSTPTMTHAADLAGVTEIRPGNYAFFDAFQVAHGSCELDDAAVTVLAAVVRCDRPRRRAVLDAGAIALSKDLGPRDVDPRAGFGRVLDLDGRDTGARVDRVTQEHGEVELPADADLDAWRVGARVRILCNHSCLTAAQHAEYHVVEGGEVVATWRPARGW